jgi:nucleoside-diphosphate-sugar epimerase
MTVLITGGTGFIGSRLALACLQRQEPVRILGQENTTAETENRRLIEERGAEVVLGSVTDAELVHSLLAGVDTVFHLAAAQHEMNVPDRHFEEVNVRGTERLVRACSARGVRRFVHGSTIGVYGAMEGTIDEETPCAPDNIYGRTKLEGESVVLRAADELSVVVIRIPETYGPGDRRLLKLFRSVLRGRFVLIGPCDNYHHPIYVDDLILGLLAAASSERVAGEVLLLAGRDVVTTRQMVEDIATALESKPPTVRLPLGPFVVAAYVMETSLRPIGIQPPLHRRRLDFFRKSFRLSPEKASQALEFRPEVGFAEGAGRTGRWYVDAGLL